MAGRRSAALIGGIALAGGALGAGCDLTEPSPPAVFVSPSSLTLEDGQSAKITAKLRNAKTRSVTWSSTNPSVATVDASGTVTGVTNGAASIVVRMTDDTTRSATVLVTVSGPPVATVAVLPASATVYVGTSLRMAVQVRAADGRVLRGRPVVWTSPDPTVADVSTTGLVRGRGPGGPITVGATSEGQRGAASIRVAHAAQLCPFVAAAAIDTRIVGRLALGDCEYPFDDSYVDVYEFTLPAAATVQVDMTSDEVDSYLGLFSGAGAFLAGDDNSGGGTHARIVAALEPGRYRVWANTSTGGSSGDYALTIAVR